MKILILSCSTGQGHNAAGLALQQELRARGVECDLVDTMAIVSERASRIVSGAYIRTATHLPYVFGAIYAIAGKISSARHKSVVYWANGLYAKKLERFLNENQYDAIVMPHLFPAEAVTAIRRRLGGTAPSFAVATDYTCIPFWEETEVDRFFIPHEDLREEFAGRGIPPEKLVVTGIPVDARFAERTDRRAAREALDLPTEPPMFLIMSGSMGFGALGRMVKKLLAQCGNGETIVVLGGNNSRRKARLRRKFSDCDNVIICDFTEQVPLYMDACDLLFTKPGGLTTTEAAVKNIPFVHTRPIPGCETINARFYESRGLSLNIKGHRDWAREAVALARDAEASARMTARQREQINRAASRDICDEILARLGEERGPAAAEIRKEG